MSEEGHAAPLSSSEEEPPGRPTCICSQEGKAFWIAIAKVVTILLVTWNTTNMYLPRAMQHLHLTSKPPAAAQSMHASQGIWERNVSTKMRSASSVNFPMRWWLRCNSNVYPILYMHALLCNTLV
jgi:hypothetical protein